MAEITEAFVRYKYENPGKDRDQDGEYEWYAGNIGSVSDRVDHRGAGQEGGVAGEFHSACSDGNGGDLFCQLFFRITAVIFCGRHKSADGFDIRIPWISGGCSTLRDSFFQNVVGFAQNYLLCKI